MTGTAKAPPLGLTMTLVGAHPMIAARLAQAGFRSAAPPALLVNADEAPDLASIAHRCTEFANAAPDGTERLIVTILPRPAHGFDHWPAAATAAGLLAFTRQAALSWGPRRIRVNMIEMAAPLPMQDVAEGLLALIGLPCVTGQRWTLGPLSRAAPATAA